VDVLSKESQTNVARANHITAIRSLLTCDKSEDGRLAGTISTYQTDVFARIDLERRTTQDILSTVGFMNV
jgi:hypothetical protein